MISPSGNNHIVSKIQMQSDIKKEFISEVWCHISSQQRELGFHITQMVPWQTVQHVFFFHFSGAFLHSPNTFSEFQVQIQAALGEHNLLVEVTSSIHILFRFIACKMTEIFHSVFFNTNWI